MTLLLALILFAADENIIGPPWTPPGFNCCIDNARDWETTWAITGPPWLTFAPTHGTLPAQSSTLVTATVNAHADTMPAGTTTEPVTVTWQRTFASCFSGPCVPAADECLTFDADGDCDVDLDDFAVIQREMTR
jgi:hypothetical protein